MLSLLVGQGFVLLDFAQNRERYGFGQIVFASFSGDFGEGNLGEFFSLILFQGPVLNSEHLQVIDLFWTCLSQ